MIVENAKLTVSGWRCVRLGGVTTVVVELEVEPGNCRKAMERTLVSLDESTSKNSLEILTRSNH